MTPTKIAANQNLAATWLGTASTCPAHTKATTGRTRIVAIANWYAVTVSGSDPSPIFLATIV